MKQKRKLYTLLIGINEYKHEKIRDLNGCERDVERINTYLDQYWSNSFDIQLKIIKSENAKKVDIVNAFLTHLTKATVDDVVMIYFSGHGGQEYADDVFLTSESDGKLEFIACHDSNIETNQNFLSDKELRYLINEVGKNGASINLFFDCCHAGDNLRDIGSEYVERLTGKKVLPKREWNEFIFAKKPLELKPQDFQGKTVSEVLPYPNIDFFHFAACTSYQSAIESRTNKEGFFTSALLNVLENVEETPSYYEIINQVRIRLRQLYHINQTPLLFFNSDNQEVIFRPLFGKYLKQKPLYKSVYFDRELLSWRIDWGQLHGVKKGEKGDFQILAFDLDGEHLWAYVKSVEIDYALLEFKPYSDISTSEVYEGFIGGVMKADLKVYVTGDEESVSLIQKAYQEHDDYQKTHRIFLTDFEKDAHFTLFINSQKVCYLTKPFDYQRPWILPVKVTPEKAIVALNDLVKANRWFYIKTLQHPEPTIPEKVIKINIEQDKSQILPNDEGIYELQLNHKMNKLKGNVHISFTNTSDKELYIGAIYLSTQLQLFTKVLDETVAKIEPQQTVHVFGGKPLPFVWDNYLSDFNWENETLRLQLIISTKRFDLTEFEQKGYPTPEKLRGEQTFKPRSLDQETVDNYRGNRWKNEETWRTNYLEFKVSKPI